MTVQESSTAQHPAQDASGINEEELARAIAQSKHEHEQGHHHHDHADFHDYT